MKKYIIILIVILLSFYDGKSQDFQPNGMYFQFYTSSSTVTRKIDVNDFKQNNFTLGWQWGGHLHMSQALKMTTNQSIFPV